MAGANKRTTCALATVAIIFIIVIIILCLVPDPCRRHDPRPECKEPKHSPFGGNVTRQQTTATVTPSTTATTTSLSRKETESSSTSQHPPSSTSTSSVETTITSSTTSTTSTWSTEESLLDTNTTTEYSTYTTESSLFTDDDSSTTSVSDITDTTNVFETFENETTTTDSTNRTTEFERESTTDEDYWDYYNDNTTDIISTTLDVNETENATEISTTVSVEATNVTEISTTETLETEDTTEMSTTVTTETTTESTTEVQSYLEVTRTTVESAGVCDTPVCKEVARRMLDIMDPRDIDPCDDFYQYACGGILDDPFLKPENPQVFADIIMKEALTYGDREDEELKDLYVMYDSCLNYSSVNNSQRLIQVKKVFEELGYQFNPMTNTLYKRANPGQPEEFDLGKALAEMMKRHFAPFFDIIIDVSNHNKSEFSLKMVLPSFTSPFTNDRAKFVCFAAYKKKAEEAKLEGIPFDVNLHYEDYANCTKLGFGLQVRMQHIERSIKELNLLGFIENSTIREQVKSEARQELDIMLGKFAKVTPSIPEIRKTVLNKEYDEFSLTEIDEGKAFGEMPFKMQKFIETLLGYKISNPEQFKIQVYFTDVFAKLFGIIYDMYDGQEPLMQNIVLLLWMEHLYDDLVSPLGKPAGSSDYCFNGVTNLMDDYVSILYLKNLPERNILENQMNHMINLTLEIMEAQVGSSALRSRHDFMEKLEKMTGEIATLEEAKTALQKNKNDVKMDLTENDFLGNYVNLMKNYRERLYNTFKEETSDNRALWSFLQFPYRNTGVTSYGLNKFLIPHGAMSPPYFYEGAPAYINYAGIGHMIAHELLHGFDTTGMKFNGAQKLEMKRDKNLIETSECLAEKLSYMFHMNSSTGFQYNFKLDASLNLDELLADLAATNLAWDTYIKGLMNQHTQSLSSTTVSPRFRTAEILSADSGMTTTLYDQALPHWENKHILRTYFIKTAQNQCSSSSEIDILRVMENEHLPPKLRVNLGVKNNKLFMEAFNCPSKPDHMRMPEDDICYFSPMGHN
ncbi:membrane metallo-endopeptidase-like 1 [Macrobrachium nipponense]|uniref:membrane metallo-endopeptidase-like 1 n=1 Tax=Macrobrachium nipponense TaxID=159736 RepID=UPI0030C85303